MSVGSAPADLPADQRRWVDAACARIDAGRLTELVAGLTSIASPTGDERRLAEHITATLAESGVGARTQLIDDRQANSVATLAGTGGGADLLLYAPIDTLTAGNEDEDVPQVGPQLRADMRAEAVVDGDYVSGLGASNPKGHAACVIAAMQAIAAAGVPLRGDLIAGFGAGGMPTNARAVPGRSRRNTGHGAGCSYLLEQGTWADFAIIAKPGWTVSWEEVGLAWFEVNVHGTHTYVGSRHRLPYANPIAAAGDVVHFLEGWFADYADRHTDGLVAPQGIVASLHAGWPRMAAVTPATATLTADLRLSPRTTPSAARREFAAAIDELGRKHPDLSLSWRMTVSIPGTSTDPQSWVVRSVITAWEALEGRPHEPATGMSGATDANILRSRGIPTARIGMPKVSGTPFEVDFARGMNTVDVRDMERLTRLLVAAAIDTCTRPAADVGVPA